MTADVLVFDIAGGHRDRPCSESGGGQVVKSDSWQKIEALYLAALKCEPAKRSAFLAENCGGDEDLRTEVESLLEFNDNAERFMEVPALELEARSVAGGQDHSLVGLHLSHYQISEKVGQGGMGVVYKADDLRLDRTVALKFLASHALADPTAKARFTREAKAAAALDHPNICTIYEIGEADEHTFLAMAYVEGETVREKIAKRPLKLEEAVDIAIQAAQGLQAAHNKGIVHRDIKSANLMVNAQGHVKIMDFGLAQLADRARLTKTTTVLGTPTYMSPEQAQSLPTGHRTDIWSLGIVFYEMVIGRVPFDGDNEQAVLYAIVHQEHEPITALRAGVPIELDRIAGKALAKNPEERYQHMDELLVDLRNVARQLRATPAIRKADSRQSVLHATNRERRLKFAVGLLGGLLVLSLAVVAVLLLRPSRLEPSGPEMRLEINTPPTTDPFSFAISPDGQKIAVVATSEGRSQLWVRSLSLDSVTWEPLSGTDGAGSPFWSPDNGSLGFLTQHNLKWIDIGGGSVQTRATVPGNRLGTGGYSGWNRDGVMIFALGGRIVRSSANGEPATVASVRGSYLQGGQFLPDGRHFIYNGLGSPDIRGVYVGDLHGPDTRRLLDVDSAAAYASPGYLLFVRDSALLAQKFDSSRLELSGNPFPVAQGVLRGPFGHIAVSASLAGPIAYRSGPVGRRHQFIWFDRSGKEIRKLGDRFDYAGFPSLSPDGRHVAFASTIDRNQDIVFLETARAATTRFTSDAGIDASPVWSPDNRRIAFASNRNGTFDTYLKDAGGAAAEDLFLAGYSPTDWSPDNRFLLCRKNDPKTSTDIWAVPLTGDRKPVPVVQTSFAEKDGQFSPDGKWIAYQSDESGRWEIYAQPFLGPGDKVPISTNGGGQVRWRRDGKELFYIGLDGRLMAVPVRFGPQTIEAGAPVALFATDVVPAVPTVDWQQYVVSPDGKQFLVSTIVEEVVTSPITVILNWRPKQ